MTTSLRFSARPATSELPGSSGMASAPDGYGVAIGSRTLSEVEILRLRSASIVAQNNSFAEEPAPEPESYSPADFELDRSAWMLAKEIAYRAIEYREDPGHLIHVETDNAQRARVAGFIPAALEAQELKYFPVV